MRAFEDGATVGEDGHFIGRDAEAKKEFVLADGFDRGAETGAESSEVQRAGTLMNLDGIAATHGDVGLGFSFEVGKFAAGAGAAGLGASDFNGLEATGPDITGDEAAVQCVFFSGEKFQRFGRFERRDELYDWAEDADCVAGFFHACGRAISFEQTGKASGEVRADGHGDAIAANGSGIDPRTIVLYGKIVDEKASFEIIRAIENQIVAGKKVGGVFGSEVGDDAFERNRGVYGAKLLFGGDGFGERFARVEFIEERLALKIGRFDEITIENAKATDSSAGEKSGSRSANCSTAYDNGARHSEAGLTGFADALKQNLAGIAVKGIQGF